MRLQADEACMYAIMDRRDLFKVICICNIVFLVFFLAAFGIGFRGLPSLLLIVIAAAEIVVCRKRWQHYDRQIMKMDGCYIEIQEQALVCRQPFDGKPEACRIYFQDITDIQAAVEPYIYITFQRGQSFVLENEKAVGREVFQIRSFGYTVSQLQQLLSQLQQQGLPVGGEQLAEKWQEKRSLTVLSMVVLGGIYILPYIIYRAAALVL